MGRGPFIYIALPIRDVQVGAATGALPDLIPINATRLLREWEMRLDPIAAMRAPDRFGDVDWLGEVFVEPTSEAMHLITEAAQTGEVYEAFANSRGLLHTSHGDEVIRELVTTEGRVHNTGLPILLGLAVTAAFLEPIGFHSRHARKGF
jgi:hypothetical protein